MRWQGGLEWREWARGCEETGVHVRAVSSRSCCISIKHREMKQQRVVVILGSRRMVITAAWLWKNCLSARTADPWVYVCTFRGVVYASEIRQGKLICLIACWTFESFAGKCPKNLLVKPLPTLHLFPANLIWAQQYPRYTDKASWTPS